MEEGAIEVDSIEAIGRPGITLELVRASEFLGVVDVFEETSHGSDSKILSGAFSLVRARRKRKWVI